MNNTQTIAIDGTLKELINDAIITVCTTQFKKDAKTEHELLETYGYKIYKVDGHFCVQSNNRTVSIVFINSSKYMWRVTYGYYSKHTKSFRALYDLKKFDFVNCLNTPINTEFYNLMQYNEGWGGIDDKHAKYERIKNKLHNLKWNANYYSREVDNIQKKIDDMQKQIVALQNDMLRYKEKAIRGEVELDSFRKELGLA